MKEKILEQQLVNETSEQKNTRFVEGRLTEQEIKNHWERPDEFLFEHEIKKDKEGQEQKTKFRVRALNEKLKDDLLDSVKNSWFEGDFNELKETLENFFKQKELDHPALLNVEYYVATDTENKPFAITGIYTDDIYGGAGFATSDKLDLSNHYLATRLGWFSVGEQYQGTGVGGFLFDWTEKMAKSRGSKVMAVETDDYKNEETALNLYENRGYKSGLDIKDYFGPGRDMVNYYAKIEEGEAFVPEEKVGRENKDELLELGKKIYSAERQKEFEVCLDLFLQQREEEETIMAPHSFVLRNQDRKISSFSIMMTGVYGNVICSCWEGADPSVESSKKDLTESLKGYARAQEMSMLLLTREGTDDEFLKNGFLSANDGVPEFYEQGDPTRFLLYSKRL